MKKSIFTILGWALSALAVGGLFILAANLPTNGYELRFEDSLSALQANSLSKAAEDLGLNLALWKEDSETVTTDLGRSSAADFNHAGLCRGDDLELPVDFTAFPGRTASRRPVCTGAHRGQASGMDVRSVPVWPMHFLEVVK